MIIQPIECRTSSELFIQQNIPLQSDGLLKQIITYFFIFKNVNPSDFH